MEVCEEPVGYRCIRSEGSNVKIDPPRRLKIICSSSTVEAQELETQ